MVKNRDFWKTARCLRIIVHIIYGDLGSGLREEREQAVVDPVVVLPAVIAQAVATHAESFHAKETDHFTEDDYQAHSTCALDIPRTDVVANTAR